MKRVLNKIIKLITTPFVSFFEKYILQSKVYKKNYSKWFKFYTHKYIYPKEYNKYAQEPIDESKVLFVELRHPQITNSFSFLFDELSTKYDMNIHCHFLRNSFVNRQKVHERNLSLIRDMATAKVIFVNESSQIINCVNLREGTQLVNTWHGCGAFKKFGLSTADLIFGDDRKTMNKYSFSKNNSIVTVSSPEVVWAYEEAFNHKPEQNIVQPLGVSRTDYFYRQDSIDNAYKNLHELFPQSVGKKVILFAPTFRGRVAEATTSTLFDLEQFYQEFKDEYVVICKHHPLVKHIDPIPEHLQNFAVDFTSTMSIEDLLCVSDICISDYSSLVFEYSLFERPLIFFAYDLDTYFDWRGFYYDYQDLAPGPICKTNQEMIEYIKNLDERFDVDKIKAFKEKFMASCDGNSTTRIIESVFGSELEKYRREQQLEGSYYDIPTSQPTFAKQQENLDMMRNLSNTVSAQYDEITIEKNQVVIIYKNNNGLVSANYLKNEIVNTLNMEVSIVNESMNTQAMVNKFAKAKFILMTNNCSIIDVLPKKEGQKIIFIGNETFPIYKFGYENPKNLECLCKDLKNICIPYKNIDDICVSSEMLEPIYSNSIKYGKTKVVGSLLGDLICDDTFKQQSLATLHKIMPQAKGKKIILYMPTKRQLNNELVLLNFERLQEVFEDEYVILFHYGSKYKYVRNLLNDYSESIIDFFGTSLSLLKAVSIADVIVGDVRPEMMLSTLRHVPIYTYTPDGFVFKKERFLNFNLEKLEYSKQIQDIDDFIKNIGDIKNYDYGNIEKFVQQYYPHNSEPVLSNIIELLK